LGDLHDRPFQAAERRGEFGGVLGAVEPQAENTIGCNPRRNPADIGADAGVACRTRRETVSFAVVQVGPRGAQIKLPVI
jgi:hypothetical protein